MDTCPGVCAETRDIDDEKDEEKLCRDDWETVSLSASSVAVLFVSLKSDWDVERNTHKQTHMMEKKKSLTKNEAGKI